MPGIDRETILAKLQEMKQARKSIVGGGAGAALSAKCEEAGGIGPVGQSDCARDD